MILPVFTPAELAEVKAYAWPHYLWLPAGIAYDALYAVLFLRFGVRPLYRLSEHLSLRLGRALRRPFQAPVLRALPRVLERLWGSPSWGAALLFAAFAFAVVRVAYLPEKIYFNFVLEHRHGLSNQGFGGYLLHYGKNLALSACATGFLTLGLFGLMRRLRRWWLVLGVVSGIALLASSALDPYRDRLFYEQTALPAGQLRQELTALLAHAQVDFREIVVEKTSVESKKLDAYFAGQGPTRTIVLTDSLLAQFAPDEIEAAVAHEAGHVHQHRWPTWAGSALGVLGFLWLLDWLFRLAARRRWFGVTEPADIRLAPLMGFSLMLLTLVVMPASAWASRERERDADRFALRLTSDPEAFTRMLVKAARVNKMDPQPPAWFAWSLSHPSIEERLEATAAWAKK
jgi:STE24 endopeptidase